MLTVLALIAAYLVGSIPTGVLVGRLRGFDPRAVGSGNIGMANVARAGGSSAAALTFVGDMLKGLVPVLCARISGADPGVIGAVGLAAFVGSISSIFLGFSGGKGVACSVGIWVALSPLAVALALVVFAAVFALWRIMSLSSMSAAVALVPIAIVISAPGPYLALAIVMAGLILVRHHENIGRLMRGEEPAFAPGKAGARST